MADVFPAQVIQIGNSLGVTIPKVYVDAYGYRKGQAFKVTLEPLESRNTNKVTETAQERAQALKGPSYSLDRFSRSIRQTVRFGDGSEYPVEIYVEGRKSGGNRRKPSETMRTHKNALRPSSPT